MPHLHVLDAPLRTALLALLAALLIVATCTGIVYFALQGSLLGVTLSASILGYGAVAVGGRAWKDLALSG